MMHLVVDNTRPIDLPDLYDGIQDNEPPLGQSIAFMAGMMVRRAWGMAFWIALGLVIGLMV